MGYTTKGGGFVCAEEDADEGEAGSKLMDGRAADTARMRRDPLFGRVVTSLPGGEDGGTLPPGEESGAGGFLANPETFDLTRMWPPTVEPTGLGGAELSPGSCIVVLMGVRSPKEELDEIRCRVRLPLRFRVTVCSASLETDERGRSSGDVSPECALITDGVVDLGGRTVTRAFTATGWAGGDVAPFAVRCLNGDGARGGAGAFETVECVLEIADGELGYVLKREPGADVVTFARGRTGREGTAEEAFVGEGDRATFAVARTWATLVVTCRTLGDASGGELRGTDLWSLGRSVHGRWS